MDGCGGFFGICECDGIGGDSDVPFYVRAGLCGRFLVVSWNGDDGGGK
jgi:hypothetical protein